MNNKEKKVSIDMQENNEKIVVHGNSIEIGDHGSITFLDRTVGDSTHSMHTDFYVYEWFIKETGEIFYVGKGRGKRYSQYHEHAYAMEKIRAMYNTDFRFIGENLTEEQALELETNEMIRILNETDYCLTNRIVPLFCKRSSSYYMSKTTPPFQFETAPILYTCELDEHYFGIKGRPFDSVDYQNLSNVFFIDSGFNADELNIVYGEEYDRYLKETIAMLEANGNKLSSSRYAKSISAWIYSCADLVASNDADEQKAKECLGRYIPCYHLIDVWKLLKKEYGDVNNHGVISIHINPVNNRCPLSDIRNLNDSDAGYDAGYKYWEKGESERKKGNYEQAISLFDKARYNGYAAPALYKSYAMVYRKLKDMDNLISILDEGIERLKRDQYCNHRILVDLEMQRKKAFDKYSSKMSL